jgi:transporter family protein
MAEFLKTWQAFALGSAFFAALTAVFGKMGVSDINSNFATFIRTVVILIVTALIVSSRREWEAPQAISWHSLTFLVLSGAATGLSWLCYYRALQLGPISSVAPIDKLSVALVIAFGVLFFGEHLTWQTAVGGALIVLGSLLIALA